MSLGKMERESGKGRAEGSKFEFNRQEGYRIALDVKIRLIGQFVTQIVDGRLYKVHVVRPCLGFQARPIPSWTRASHWRMSQPMGSSGGRSVAVSFPFRFLLDSFPFSHL